MKRNITLAYLIAAGNTNDEIAQQLDISLYNVKKYVNDIYEATGLSTRAEVTKLIKENMWNI